MPSHTSETPLPNSLKGIGPKEQRDCTLVALSSTSTFPRNPCYRIMTPEGKGMITNSLPMRTLKISLPFLMTAKPIRRSPMPLLETMTTVKILENIKGRSGIMMSL
jgi:hypothetical protein